MAGDEALRCIEGRVSERDWARLTLRSIEGIGWQKHGMERVCPGQWRQDREVVQGWNVEAHAASGLALGDGSWRVGPSRSMAPEGEVEIP